LQPILLCFSRLVYPMLPVSLDCPFLIAPSVFSNVQLHYVCNRQEIHDHTTLDTRALAICLKHHIVPLVQVTIPRAQPTVLLSTCPVDR